MLQPTPTVAVDPLTAPHLTRRLACLVYEGVLLFAVVFFSGLLFSTLTQSHHAMEHRTALQAVIFIVLALYFVWCWHHGQTLAMRTWRIRLVDRQGRALTKKRALVRYLLSWLWFLPSLVAIAPFHPTGPAAISIVLGWILIWAILSRFHPQRQFWHDAWAGTFLIRSPSFSR